LFHVGLYFKRTTKIVIILALIIIFVGMIRIVSALVVILFTQVVFAQSKPLKRKYRGTYTGEIPAYNVVLGSKEVAVKSQAIELTILKDSVLLKIGKYNYADTYIVQKNLNHFELNCERENSGINELLILDPKSKTVLRKGLFPQPDAVLVQKKKSAKR